MSRLPSERKLIFILFYFFIILSFNFKAYAKNENKNGIVKVNSQKKLQQEKRKEEKRILKEINLSKNFKKQKKYTKSLSTLDILLNQTENPHLLNRIYLEKSLVYLEIKNLEEAEKNFYQIKKEILPEAILEIYTIIENTIKKAKNKKIVSQNKDEIFLCEENIFNLVVNKKPEEVVKYYKENNLQNKNDYYCEIFLSNSYQALGKIHSALNIIEKIEKDKNLTQNKIDLLKVKINKANACLNLKDFKCSIEECDYILNNNENILDKKQIQGVDNLKQIAIKAQKEEKIFGGRIGFSSGYDTNPNFANALNRVYLYTLQNASNIQADFSFNNNINLNYSYQINRNFSTFGFVDASYLIYKDVKDRNSLRFNVSQGFLYRYNKHGIIFNASYQNMFLGQTSFIGERFFDIYSGSLGYFYKYNNQFTFRINYQFLLKKMSYIQYRDSYTHAINLQADMNFLPRTWLFLSIGGGFENAQKSYYSNFLLTSFAGIRHFLFDLPIYIDIFYNFTMLDFLSSNPAFGKKRLDYYHGISCSIHLLALKYFDIFARYDYTKNISQVALYDFTRHIGSVGFRFVF